MILTTEQVDALKSGRTVRIVAPEVGGDCIVMRAEIFDRVQRILDYDDRPWTPAERAALLRSFGEKAGWDDPEMDVYEEYRRQP